MGGRQGWTERSVSSCSHSFRRPTLCRAKTSRLVSLRRVPDRQLTLHLAPAFFVASLDPSLALRRKTAFLLSTLLLSLPATLPSPNSTSLPPLLTSFQRHSLASTLLTSLTPSSSHPAPGANSDESPASEDADYREKAARVLISLIERGALSEQEKEELKGLWKSWEQGEGGLEDAVWVGKEEETTVRVLLGL